MTSPPVKATETLEKLPTTKLSRSSYTSNDNPKPKVNVSYKKVPRESVDSCKVSYPIFYELYPNSEIHGLT